jgi:GTP cyclohydrolase-4
MPSHNQRAKVTVHVGTHNPTSSVVDLTALIDVIEGSMSGRIHSVLKRPDEAALVRTAHLNPLFAEDVVRLVAAKLGQPAFGDIPDESPVNITIESFESIHFHNVYAEIQSTFRELRQGARSGLGH